MNIRALGEARRVQGDFSAANSGMADGQRDENVVLERVVVEEISGAGAEVGDVERPAGDGNREAEFALLIPLTVKWGEIETQERS